MLTAARLRAIVIPRFAHLRFDGLAFTVLDDSSSSPRSEGPPSTQPTWRVWCEGACRGPSCPARPHFLPLVCPLCFNQTLLRGTYGSPRALTSTPSTYGWNTLSYVECSNVTTGASLQDQLLRPAIEIDTAQIVRLPAGLVQELIDRRVMVAEIIRLALRVEKRIEKAIGVRVIGIPCIT